jgi:uncharacterized membrane protein
MKPTYNPFDLDRMAKDPENWRGPFYLCRKDPRLIVPKIDSSIGWGGTFNCANPFTFIVLIGIVIITIATMYLLK